MQIVQLDPHNGGQIRKFLNLPFHIFQDNPQWVPPLEMDIKRVFDRQHHPFYKHSQAAFFMALDRNGEVIGRLAVLDNHNYNSFNKERTAFFYLFECKNNQKAANDLFESAFAWSRQRGLDNMIGPKGFTALDGMGLLVKGFEHRPAFGIPYNAHYYPALIEGAGFKTKNDVVSGYLHASAQFPEKIHQIAQLVQERRGLRVTRFKTRRDLRAIIPKLRELYNAALGGTSGGVPLTDDEAQTMANQMLWFTDPSLIKIVMKEEEPVGFLFAYPDISAAVQRTKGRLFPFGWVDMLLELRRTKWVNINGAGIIEKYRGLGGIALLFSEMHKSVIEGGFVYENHISQHQPN